MADIKYTAPRCKFSVEGGHIVTDGSVRNKVTGTSVAGILGCSPWSTPFQVACALLGLGREDISKKPEVLVGQALESEIIKYAGKTYGQYGLFMSADEVYEKREGDHDAWESDFVDNVFAGHVDGIVMREEPILDKKSGFPILTEDGKPRTRGVNYILEVKTSRNYDSWLNGVPEYYYWQVALYNEFIAKQDKAYVLLGMTSEATMKDVNSWVANEKTVGMFEMDIDRAEVQEKMEYIRQWYNEYIVKGITPEHDPTNPKDVALYDHLVNITQDVGDIANLIDQLAEVDGRILEFEAEQKSLYEFRDSLKDRIKEYQTVHRISEIESTSGDYISQMTERPYTKWNEAQMKKDGIDVDKYKTVTMSKYVSIRKKGNKK